MWRNVAGHDDVVSHFRRMLRSGRLASTFLFAGPPGIGKRQFALQLAEALLCHARADDSLEVCGQCESCRLAAAGNHPDLMTVCLPPEKSTLPIELFVGDRTHRQSAGLCHHLSLKPFLGGRRIAVIDDADHLSQESANCLLKTLEEPPPNSVLILIGTSPAKQLPTIRSRSQLVRFRPLSEELAAELIQSAGLTDDPAEAQRLAGYCDGSLGRARELADSDLWPFRQELLTWLSAPDFDVVRATRSVLEFVEASGKESAARRARLRIVLRFAAEHYRQRMRTDCSPSTADKLDHCLQTLEHVDRNANQATLVGWWMSGLAA